jgi:ABC-2 type transport system permease protein
MAPYVVISIFDVAVVLLVSVFHFHMQIVGSLLQLCIATFIFLLSSLGLGLLISTMSQNQIQASQMSQLILLPSILISGYMFPREAMPKVLQWLGAALPLTYFLQILRGIILKGAGLVTLWKQTVSMTVYTFVILAFAVFRMRKKLD